MKVAYIRTSTVEQHEDRQIEALKKYGIEKTFIEKVSAKDTDRPRLQEMLSFVREGDTVYVQSFDRLARSTQDLLSIVEKLKAEKVELVSDKENIDTSTATGKLMLTMVAAIAEFERTNLLERQREGIAIAKAKGVYKGRKKVTIDEEKYEVLYEQYMKRKLSKSEMAKRLGISRPTLDKLLKKKNQ